MGISIFNDFTATTGRQICVKTDENVNAVRKQIREFYNSKGYSEDMVSIKTLVESLPVIVSALVAIPVSYTVISRWLEGYVIRTENSPVIYLSALAIVLTIVILSVHVQALRMMQTNPSEVLKKE